MARRGFIVTLLVVTAISTLQSVSAQQRSTSSLADRFKAIREGWKVRSGQAEEKTQQPPQAAASSKPRRDSRLPRIDSRKLMPRDYSAARRTTPSNRNELGRNSQSLGSARVAKRPGSDSQEAREPRTLGEAYLQAPLELTSPPAREESTTFPEPDFISTRTPGDSSPTPLSKEPDSRPSPSIRRSPQSGNRYDFDPEELRRDLVDSTGKAVSERRQSGTQPRPRPLLSQQLAKTDEESELGGQAEPKSALPIDTSREDEEAGQDSSDGFRPITAGQPNTDSLAQGTPEADVSVDQERVKIAGERAFSQANQLPAQPGLGTFSATDGVSSSPGLHTDSAMTEPQSNLLVSNRMPVIISRVMGPQQILIGREATFQLTLANQSEVSANEVVARIHVPEWADVVDTIASNGIIQRAQDSSQPNTYRWQLHRLAASGKETLEVKLIPRSSRPLELGINWTYTPVGSHAIVEVQEPKLRMHVSGPDEVLFNKPQLYRLTLTNPGTGIAEEVKIDLLPPGGGDDTASTHVIGKLHPGTSKSVEVELTAREPGKLTIQASATAIGGINAEAAKEIFCRKPELEVDWRGPEQKYAGTVATYYFRVRNPGTAAADDISIGVKLPAGVEFLNASEGQVFDASRQTVSWKVSSLRPGDDYYMELKCLVNTAGTNRLEISASAADGSLSDSDYAETNVIALADLKLEVTDPKGPIPVGEEAVYEIRVRNRGTNTAEQVNIVALFSEGIDAQAVEGAQYSISDGRVTFRTIEKLAAGREVVLRIRTKANQPGTHVFRAEVLCRDLEIKLAAEETTRFFQDESLGATSDGSPYSAGRPFQDEGARY